MPKFDVCFPEPGSAAREDQYFGPSTVFCQMAGETPYRFSRGHHLESNPERKPEWRATPSSPGRYKAAA